MDISTNTGLLLVSSLPMIVCFQWTVTLLLEMRRAHKPAQGHLLVFMATATLLYACHFAFYSRTAYLSTIEDILYSTCNLLVYPLYLLYMARLTQGGLRRRCTVLWLTPAAVAAVASALVHIADSEVAHEWCRRCCRVTFTITVVLVWLRGLRLLRDFRRRIENIFSDTEGRTLKPIGLLLSLLTVASVLSIMANFVGRDWFADSALLLAGPSVVFSALLYFAGYIGIRPPFSYEDLEIDEQQVETEDNSTDTPEVIDKLAQKIEAAMQMQRLYLEPDLRITDIARLLGTNDKYVSMAINTVLGKTFTEYVNSYRTAYARELQKKEPELLATETARRSGFRSMASFYRHMRQAT